MIKDAVMENDFLKNLDATQVREIVESMYPREFEKGSYVIREGDAGKQQHEKNEVQKYVLVFWMEKVFSGEKNKKKKQTLNMIGLWWIYITKNNFPSISFRFSLGCGHLWQRLRYKVYTSLVI